jgi:membrane-associated protein
LEILDLVLHVDKYLEYIANNYGSLVYLILFLIIFSETGLVVAPFLPGDSLLFVLGTFTGKGILELKIVYPLLLTAAVLGNVVNFFIGYYFGEKIIRNGKFKKLIKEKHLKETEIFFQKHGGKAVIISRFLPFVRTFVPFVAGIAKMDTSQFMLYNLIGGFLWITFFIFLGYFTGNIPFVKENFSIFIYLIITISFIPVILKTVRK